MKKGKFLIMYLDVFIIPIKHVYLLRVDSRIIWVGWGSSLLNCICSKECIKTFNFVMVSYSFYWTDNTVQQNLEKNHFPQFGDSKVGVKCVNC